jgi:hypothetical protein
LTIRGPSFGGFEAKRRANASEPSTQLLTATGRGRVVALLSFGGPPSGVSW